MEFKIIHIQETDSTNRWLRSLESKDSGIIGLTEADYPEILKSLELNQSLVVWAEYQTAGRGCGTNTWESERGKNLTFSVLLHPDGVAANRQFQISMQVSLALCEALGRHIGDLSIKWPNDIYWRNGKIAGILIENRLQGTTIRDSIVGIGLNVNQREFRSDAPNPVSLWQICEHEIDREQLLHDFLEALNDCLGRDMRTQYLSMLYRRRGFHPYTDKDGAFMAEIADVEDDGHLVLRDEEGQERRYAFKEVQFVI